MTSTVINQTPLDGQLLRDRRPRSVSPWMIVYAYVAIAFCSNALDRLLSGGMFSEGGSAASPAIQIFGSLIILVTCVILGRHLLIGRGSQPLYPTTIGLILGLLGLWTAMSIGWSADPGISIRRGIAFVGTILIGWTLATCVPRDEMFRVLGRAAIAFIFISVILAIVFPVIAYHQPGPMVNPDHVGRMRGSFGHKNEFARMLALAMSLAIVPGWSVFRRKWLVIAALAAGSLMLVLSGSAKVMVALPVALIGALAIKFCKTVVQRFALLVFVGFPAFFLVASGLFDAIMVTIFAEVGRDASMSGRDVIWAAAERSIADHLLIGQGYAAGWEAQAAHEMQMLSGNIDVMGHAHNGYLNTMLDLGLIGLLLALAPIAYLLWDLLFPRTRRSLRLEFISASFIILFLLMNVTGSYLTNYNDIYTVLLVCLAIWTSHERRSFRLLLKRKQLGAASTHDLPAAAAARLSTSQARKQAL